MKGKIAQTADRQHTLACGYNLRVLYMIAGDNQRMAPTIRLRIVRNEQEMQMPVKSSILNR